MVGEEWLEIKTREEWLEIKTLHYYGRMYTRGSFDKAPVQKRADNLRTKARAQLHALDQRPFRTADGHVGPMQGYFNERPYHGLVFGYFNETSAQGGKVLYARAVNAVYTRAFNMGGGVVKVQEIAAVNSWLQRSLSCCVAKATARLFQERLKLVAPTNAPARHRGISAALGMIIGQQADWNAAHDYRPFTRWRGAPGLTLQALQPVVDICHSTL